MLANGVKSYINYQQDAHYLFFIKHTGNVYFYITLIVFSHLGVGLGLSSNTTFIVLGQYFLQYYGVTTGVIMASFASGRLIFSPIIQLMLDTYGFRGVCLIIGGLMLNCLVGAAVCQPAKWHTILVPIPKKDIPNNNSSKQSSASDHEKKTIPEVTNGFATLKNDELKCNTSEPIEIQEKLLKNDDLKDSSNLDRNGSVFLASSWDIVNNTEIVASQLVIDKQSLKKSNGCQSCCVKGPFKGLQFSLLKLPIFYVCLFGGILSFISAVYISVFTPPFALQYNISPMNVATMASIRSGFEITGRLVTPLAFKTFGKKCPLIVFYCILTAAQAVAILSKLNLPCLLLLKLL